MLGIGVPETSCVEKEENVASFSLEELASISAYLQCTPSMASFLAALEHFEKGKGNPDIVA